VIEVTPGIYQLQLPLPNISLRHVNTYLVQGDNGYLLVDTGWNTEEAFDSLKEQLDEKSISLEDVTQIVVTHVHPDHYGLAGKIKQLSHATLVMHHIEKGFIESRYAAMTGLLQQTEQWLHINGVPPEELTELKLASAEMAKFVTPTMPDFTLSGGETVPCGVFNFQVLWTPGHSPGHICLYESSQKVLISGDHILPTITPIIGLHPQSNHNPLGDYLNSLNTLKQLDIRLILPGHEHPFTGIKQRAQQIIQHHEQRNLEILRILNTTSKTTYQIATEMTWMSHINGVGWQELTPLDKRLAVLETLAHLEEMRVAGRVSKFIRDDIIHYRVEKWEKQIPAEDAESIATVQDAVVYLKGLGVDEHLQ